MNLAVFAYSRQGCRTARAIMAAFPGETWRAFTMERFGAEGFSPIPSPSKPLYGEMFHWAQGLVFVGSCGIAVREIAPHLQGKALDPAVVCVDELGRFSISLLSGHIGGGNEWAKKIADALDATAVITTATDIHSRFSVDAWAAKNGFVIDSLPLAKAVSAAILEGDVPLASDFPVVTPYPRGVFPGEGGELGICLSWEEKRPFRQTLRLIPRCLHLGLGCRKGTGAEAIREAVGQVLAQNRIDPRSVKTVASIDLKAEESGLLQYCQTLGISPVFYSPAQLRAVPGDYRASEFVEKTTGVDNVCERSAMAGAEKLIVRKTAAYGVTVALAAEAVEVRFG